MKITINDLVMELDDATTLARLLEMKSIDLRGVAVAVNDTVVPRADIASRQLIDGDKVLVIKAFYGG